MRHAANRRAAGRQQWAAPIYDLHGELRPISPRRPARYGKPAGVNPPDRDHDEELAARDEWEDER